MSFLTLIGLATLLSLFNTNIEGSIDRIGEPIIVTVYFYDSPEQVTDKFKEVKGISRIRRIPIHDGFAVWTEWGSGDKPDDELYTCEIHALRPRRIDDSRTTLLGHEMLHCLIGSFH